MSRVRGAGFSSAVADRLVRRPYWLFSVLKRSVAYCTNLGWFAGACAIVEVGVACMIGRKRVPPPMQFIVPQGEAGAVKKRIALTLDDGPSWGTPNSTDQILAILDKYGVKATFFVVGAQVDGNPTAVQREFDAGHLILNHSLTHPEFSTLSRQQMIDEIDTVNARLDELGIPVRQYFRPPYGDGDGATLASVLGERGMTAVYWTIDSRDYKISDPEQIRQNVLQDLQNAWNSSQLTNVILFHDIQPHTPAVMDLLIPDLQAAGCEFVQIDAIV